MTKLYPFQKEDVKHIIKLNGRVLLASEMGLGKTIQALYFLRQAPKKGFNTLPAIVVCPSIAKWVWKDQAKEHIGMRCRIINGKQPKILKTNKQLIIINYEILDSWVKYLRKLKPMTVILDECHFIKNNKVIRTKAARRICKNIPYILALSGTPLVNRPKEMYNTLKILDPIRWKYYVNYAEKYCDRKWNYWGGWDDTGSSNIKTLHRILRKTCMIRRLKKDVLKELPEKTRVIVPLNIDIKKYVQAEIDFIKLGEVKKAIQLVKLGYLKRLAAELKMKLVISWIDNFLGESDGKLIIFGIHKIIIKELQEHYSKISVVVDGSVSHSKRQDAVKQFQENNETRLFIGNIQAAGTAITLTAADTVAFIELDWVPGNHVQAEDRAHRIGQKNNVTVYYLIAKGTIEEDLCKIIQKKAKIISSILDGGKQATELNVYNELMSIIKERNLL